LKSLPESFDMAKRLGLFCWISKNLNGPIAFEELFQKFRASHNVLSSEVKNSYSADDKNADLWALQKVRIGLPNSRSKTSFSKYVRVGHGLGILNMERSETLMILKPEWMTYLLREFSNEQRNTFELTDKEKVLLFTRLLQVDDIFIVPLLKVLSILPLSRNRWIADKEFNSLFAKTVIDYLSTGFLETISEKPTTLLNKYKFIKHNLSLLEQGEEPTRGFLHMVEPRVHWLIDLGAIDSFAFFNRGEIRSYTSKAELANYSFLSDDFSTNPLVTTFVEHLVKDKTPRHASIPKEELLPILQSAIQNLREAYPNLVPVEAIVASVFASSAVKFGKTIPYQIILDMIENEFSIYRGYRSGLGFIDTKLENQQA
jgi:hypothetical protein